MRRVGRESILGCWRDGGGLFDGVDRGLLEVEGKLDYWDEWWIWGFGGKLEE